MTKSFVKYLKSSQLLWVAARTAELETANKDLEGFSYSVSHDLRAPIRAILGFGALLAEEHQAELNDEGRRKLGIIRQEAERMGRLIDDLLTFSRLGRKALEPVELDMTAMVQSVVNRLTQDGSASKTEFRISSLPSAMGGSEQRLRPIPRRRTA